MRPSIFCWPYAPFLVALLVASTAARSQAMEQDLDQEFSRVEKKHQGNRTMMGPLNTMRSSWLEYRNARCHFERTAAAGGAVVKPVPPEAQRAWQRCLVQTSAEIKAVLANY